MAGTTATNRHDAISAVNDAILAAGGWLVRHSLFSNMAASFLMSLPPEGFAVLCRRLDDAGVHLDAKSQDAIASALEKDGSGGEVLATLNLTFVHDEPDLRHEIPSVPG